jgi:hypothetical protein
MKSSGLTPYYERVLLGGEPYYLLSSVMDSFIIIGNYEMGSVGDFAKQRTMIVERAKAPLIDYGAKTLSI